MRKIIVVDDSLGGRDTVVTPHGIAEDLWCQSVVLAHHLEVHYDATVVLTQPQREVFAMEAPKGCLDCVEFGQQACEEHKAK